MRWVNQTAVLWAVQQGLTGLQRLALIEVAAYSNPNGIAFPSMRTLAASLGVSQRQARRIVSYLVKSGYLVRRGRAGRSNLLMISCQMGEEVGHPCPTPADTHVLPPRTPVSAIKRAVKKSSKEPPLPPRGGRVKQRSSVNLETALRYCKEAGRGPEFEQLYEVECMPMNLALQELGFYVGPPT